MRDVTDTHNAIEEAECWGCVYLFCVSVSVCWCQMLDVRVGDKGRDWDWPEAYFCSQVGITCLMLDLALMIGH